MAQADERADSVVLDMDSSERPVHGQQERSAYNGHFESVCQCSCSTTRAPASRRSCVRATSAAPTTATICSSPKLNVEGKHVAFRADAAFAKSEVYEALEARGVAYAILIPANRNLELAIEDLLFVRVDGPVVDRSCGTRASRTRRQPG